MDSLVRLLGTLLTRDLIYVVGGTNVCVALLYFAGYRALDANIYAFIALALLGYVVGYLLQDGLVMLVPSVTPSAAFVPNSISKWAFKRFTGHRWIELPIDTDINREYFRVTSGLEEAKLRQMERLLTLELIGTVMCPSFLVCGLILFVKALQQMTQIDVILSASCFLLSIFGFLSSRAKNLQLKMEIHRLHKLYCETVPTGVLDENGSRRRE